MRVDPTLLCALLLTCMSDMSIAGEQPIDRCRIPPKIIMADSKHQSHPPSTARPPVGIVVLELTVTTDGTIQDVSVVKPVDSRLQRWAIEKSKTLRYQPVKKACRTQITLESRITDEADGA